MHHVLRVIVAIVWSAMTALPAAAQLQCPIHRPECTANDLPIKASSQTIVAEANLMALRQCYEGCFLKYNVCINGPCGDTCMRACARNNDDCKESCDSQYGD